MPTLTGPKGPIPFTRDRWGYPRIRVRDRDEAAWAIGYFHALDRQVQVQVITLAGRGRLMELIGDEPVIRGSDRALRGLGLALDLDDQIAALNAETRAHGERYCEGFNAGAMVGGGRRAMLRMLGLPQAPYGLKDIVLVYRMLAWFGLNSLTQANAESIGQLIAAGVTREQLELLLGADAAGVDLERGRGVAWPAYIREVFGGGARGSNAFAVSAERSRTGAALLMGEFHMEVGRFPPIAYAAHIEYESGEYEHGVSIPGLPTIVSGRNRHVGWSYTFGHARNFDVWIERCEGGKARVGDEWRPLRRRTERVSIRRNKAPELWTFWDSERGTIHGDAMAGGELPCVAWRGLRETHEDLNALMRMADARSVDELVALHRRVKCISLAATFVDREGHIGYVQTGRVAADPASWGPRAAWTREPGDDPDLDEDARPCVVDPPEGFIASANEARRPWTGFAEPPHRVERLRELLSESHDEGDRLNTLAPDDLVRISYDEYDRMAAWLLPIWAPHLPDAPAARALVTWARRQGWRRAPAEGALLERFHVLHRELTRALLERRFGEDARWILDNHALLLGIQAELDHALALERPALLDAEELASLLPRAWEASARVLATPGPHAPVRRRARFANLLTQGKEPAFLKLSSPAVELPGGPVSVFQMRLSVVGGREIISGPAFHVLIDMSGDTTRYNIAGGASERWRGPGYGSAVEEWRVGELIELGGADD